MKKTIPVAVDGVQCIWIFRSNGELLFFAKAAPGQLGIPLDPDDWDIPATVQFTGNSGCCVNSLKVIRKITAIAQGWLNSHRPNHLWIRCSCPKKLRLFRKLVDRGASAAGCIAWNDAQAIYLQRT